MNQPNLLALYGLKFNPFAQDIPVEACLLYTSDAAENREV